MLFSPAPSAHAEMEGVAPRKQTLQHVGKRTSVVSKMKSEKGDTRRESVRVRELAAASNSALAGSLREAGNVAGNIAKLLGLLDSWQDGEVADKVVAADQIQSLARDPAVKELVREKNGFPMLVAPLEAGPSSDLATTSAGALQNLARNKLNKDAVREAGGIPALVVLLERGGLGSDAAEVASTEPSISLNLPYISLIPPFYLPSISPGGAGDAGGARAEQRGQRREDQGVRRAAPHRTGAHLPRCPLDLPHTP